MNGVDTAPWAKARDALAEQERIGQIWETETAGQRRHLFGLVFWTGVLTVLTLGIYRFWQKTRVRRWLWSSLRPGGYPLEYVGDPFEKLLGFLIAVVVLAFYIGVVNLALMVISFALLQGQAAAYAVSLLGILPFWFYAQYRARRYVLARTRWVGLRFGQAPGAWGYALRALWHGALTLLTLGLLWPRMTFKLEQYRADRTFFGDQRMAQGGRWTMLFGALRWHWVALILGGLSLAYSEDAPQMSLWTGLAGGAVLLYALAYYRVETLKRLTAQKTIGPLRLALTLSPRRVLLVSLLGYGLAALATAAPLALLVLCLVELQPLETIVALGLEGVPPVLAQVATPALIALIVVSYFATFLLWSALTQTFVRLPLLRLTAEGLRLENADALTGIRQRPRDDHLEAEGFAEALDVGVSL